MAVHRLNHVVLFVRDVEVSATFYAEVLGFTQLFSMPGRAVFMRAPGSTNDHDLGLFAVGEDAAASPAGRGAVGMYHVAWEVTTLSDLVGIRDELSRRGHLVGMTDHGTTKALYGVDPDGLEFEVSWLVPARLLSDQVLEARTTNRPLHLEREIERYGAETTGGLGVSVPLGVLDEV